MAETTDDRLRLLIERVERLEEEKKGIADDIRDVYGEAKAVGYDVKVMRQIVRLRKMAPDARNEMETILDLYKCALGLGGGDRRQLEPTPLEVAIAKATDDELAARGLVRVDVETVAGDRPDLVKLACQIHENGGRVEERDGENVLVIPMGGDQAEAGDQYERAVALVVESGKSSTSWLQRQLGVGYNTAAKLIERMEAAGVVGPPDHVGKRELLRQAEPA